MMDYHLHTRLCRHASGTMEEYVEAALKKGLEEICFTPHMPMPGLYGGARLRMDLDEFDIYLNDIKRVQNRYKEIRILTGVEADFYEGYEDFLSGFLSGYSFDLVLMSVHFIRGWPEGYWAFNIDPGKSLPVVYKDYFQAVKKGIRTGLFDVVAHLDLIKQLGHPVLETNAEDVEEVIELCLQNGMSTEINSSGIRKGLGEFYPSGEILRLLTERNVPLTLGSDAHDPEQTASGLAEAAAMLRDYPKSRLVRYRHRRAERVEKNISQVAFGSAGGDP